MDNQAIIASTLHLPKTLAGCALLSNTFLAARLRQSYRV